MGRVSYFFFEKIQKKTGYLSTAFALNLDLYLDINKKSDKTGNLL